MFVKRVTKKKPRSVILSAEVETFCRDLVAQYRPIRVTLFGSHALGNARPDSDVDLLVELDHVDSGLGTAAGMVRTIQPRFAVDLIVRTPGQVRDRIKMGDSFLAQIVSTGKVLYETSDR